MEPMDWDKVIVSLENDALLHRNLVNDPYKSSQIKQAAATVCAIQQSIAAALRKGLSDG